MSYKIFLVILSYLKENYLKIFLFWFVNFSILLLFYYKRNNEINYYKKNITDIFRLKELLILGL